MILDQLFLDLTVRRQHWMMYRNEEKLLQKHQVNDFRPYTNLLLTCKEINKEAKNHWDKYYLQQCCFYFWHVSKLYDLAQILDRTGGPYTEVKYVLRSQCAGDHVNCFCLASTTAEVGTHEAEWFIETQPGVKPDYPEEFDKHFTQRLFAPTGAPGRAMDIGEGAHEATDEYPVRTVVYKIAGKDFARGEYPGPGTCAISAHCDKTIHESEGIRTDVYAQMQGKFSGIFWGGYDAAIGYAKLKLWEATPLRHLQDRCHCKEWKFAENRFAETKMLKRGERGRSELLQRWFKKITVDRKWLTLGGDAEAEVPHDLLAVYEMSHWLDKEHWSERAMAHWETFYMSESAWEEAEDFGRLTAAEEAFERQWEQIERERERGEVEREKLERGKIERERIEREKIDRV